MKNKKGMFFIMVTIIIIALFVLSISFYSNYTERKVVQERVESLSDFVLATENNLQRQIFISGYRMIFFMEQRIVDSNSYIPDVDSLLQEMFFNGTIYGQSEDLLEVVTYSGITQAVQARSSDISADISFANPTIELIQEDPWHVIMLFTTDFNVADHGNLASWNKTLSVKVPIMIANFSDPIHLKETEGEESIVMARTPYTDFPEDLNAHVTGKYFRENPDAPSFLKRLEGDFSASPYGVETLVFVPDISASFQTGRSIADHIYFGGGDSGCVVSGGLGSWMKLDNEHLVYYETNC